MERSVESKSVLFGIFIFALLRKFLVSTCVIMIRNYHVMLVLKVLL